MLPINPKVYVDWNNDGDFGDANEDVSAVVYEASWRRGRSTVREDFAIGTAVVVLDNQSLTYNPFDSGSAIYPNMVPGRRCKIELVHDSVTYPAFYGRISEVRETFLPTGAPAVTLALEDEFGRMSRSSFRSNAAWAGSSVLIDTLLNQATIGILRDYGYGSGQFTTEGAEQRLTKGFTFEGGSHLEALKLATKQELGGAFFIAADGKPTFYNRAHNSAAALHATWTNPSMESLAVRQEEFYDRVTVKRAGLEIGTETEAIFNLFPTGRVLAPGSTDPLNTFDGEYIVSAKDVIEPVAGTDYTANTLADGTGEDVTNQVSVSAWTSFGGGFQITLDNASGAAAYLTLFQVRGTPIRQSDESREITVSDSGAPVTNQTLRDEFVFNDDADAIRGYAKFQLLAGTQFYPRHVRVFKSPTDDTEAVEVLGLELLKRVRIVNTTDAWASGIADDFLIQAISGAVRQGGRVEVVVDLWHEIASLGTFFRISGSSGGGADYSTIAAAVDTTGDRIKF